MSVLSTLSARFRLVCYTGCYSDFREARQHGHGAPLGFAADPGVDAPDHLAGGVAEEARGDGLVDPGLGKPGGEGAAEIVAGDAGDPGTRAGGGEIAADVRPGRKQRAFGLACAEPAQDRVARCGRERDPAIGAGRLGAAHVHHAAVLGIEVDVVGRDRVELRLADAEVAPGGQVVAASLVPRAPLAGLPVRRIEGTDELLVFRATR